MDEARRPQPDPTAHIVSVRSRFHRDLADACGIGPEASFELNAAQGEEPAGPSEPEPEPTASPATDTEPALERYEHQGEAGHGGMGAVHRVFDRNLRRRVAMKVILPPRGGPAASLGAEQRRLSSRFLEESQITGQLEHPGVVPVYDLGLDERKQLYFTMRLVRGKTFGEVLELVAAGDETWNLTSSLNVLLRICDTMRYAHDKGVLHRDLKPDNVMVGRYGEVYVLDWGLARVEGREDARDLRPKTDSAFSMQTERKELGADSPLVTMDGTVVGTPYYMPREQAVGRSDRVGPRSDVYSVGAMLYHLLTGNMPYHTEGDSPSPHTVLAMVMQGPPTPVQELAPDVPAELVAICERAMGREPEDRYRDMSALASDLRAYLENRVVRAHETGALAELRKWIVRNKPLAASISATLLVSLLGLSAVGVVQARGRSAQERLNQQLGLTNLELEGSNAALVQTNRELDLALATSERVEGFLVDMFEQQDPNFSRGRTLTVKEVLDREVTRIRGQLKDEPATHARLLGSLGRVYQELSLDSQARPLLEDALERSLEAHGPEDARTWAALDRLGSVLIETRQLDEARRLLEQAAAKQSEALGEQAPATLSTRYHLATLTYYEGDLPAAREAFELLIEDQERELGAEDPETLNARSDLAAVLAAMGRSREAAAAYRELLVTMEGVLGPDDPRSLRSASNLAFALVDLGELDEAEEICTQTLELREQVLGDDDPGTLESLHNLAEVHYLKNQGQQAAREYRRAWEGRAARLGEGARPTLESLTSLAKVEASLGRGQEAELLYERFLEPAREVFAANDPALLQALSFLAQRYEASGRQEQAAALRQELQSGR